MDSYMWKMVSPHNLEYLTDMIHDTIGEFSNRYGEPNTIYLSEYLYHYLMIRYKVRLNDNGIRTLYGLEVRVDSGFDDYKFMIKKEENMNGFRIGDYTFHNNGYYYTPRDNTSNDTKLPKHYIINKGATILFWEDGTKTVIKRSKDDEYDKIKGFLWAYFQKHSGLSRNKANKYLAELMDEVDNE